MSSFAPELDRLEARADTAETGETWDVITRDLAILAAAIFDARTAARRELDEAEARVSGLGFVARLNPIDPGRREAKGAIAEAEARLESLDHDRDRLQRLRERGARYELEPFFRDLVVRAEKIQREVAADWPTKAAAVALALYRDLDGDAAIARARELLENPLAEDPRVFLAAGLFERSVKDAEVFLARAEKSDPALAAAFLASTRSIAEAADLVRDLGISREVLPAAIASDADRATIEARHFAFADRSATLRSVVLLTGASIGDVQGKLHTLRLLDDDVAAYALLSDRDAESCDQVERGLHETSRGDGDAEVRIRRAAIASARSPHACAAIVRELQQRFSGSWSSEAWIIAAAIGAEDPPEHTRRAALIVVE